MYLGESWEDRHSDLVQAIRNLPHTEKFIKMREHEVAIKKYNSLPRWRKIFTRNPKTANQLK